VNNSEDGGKFGGFLFERANLSRGQQAAFFRELKPEERFISFFQYPADFVNPVGFAASAAGGAITRSNGSRGPQDLLPDHSSLDAARQRIGHFHNPQRKSLCWSLQFFTIHTAQACDFASVQ